MPLKTRFETCRRNAVLQEFCPHPRLWLQATLLLGASLLATAAAAQDTPDFPEEEAVNEIIVTAPHPTGSIASRLAPEAVLSAEDISSLGVSSLNELMAELAPETTSVRGGHPVVLLNGRRISSFAEIREIPTEAIAGVEVLPEQAALQFGYPADQKVVNIILQDHVRTLSASLDGGMPTAGGQTSFGVKSSLLKLDRDKRLNITLSYDRSSALLESARGVIEEPPPLPYALGGNITSATPGAEIDPALSALMGRPVTVAGIPLDTTGGLSAFTGPLNGTNPGAYRTLLPETESVKLNAVVSRNLSDAITASFTADLAYDNSKSQQGLATSSTLLPASNPFSPFAGDVLVNRYIDVLGPLKQRARSLTGNFGATLNGRLSSWQWTATATYDIASTRTNTLRRIDSSAWQAAILNATPGLDPFAAIPENDLVPHNDQARSTVQSGDIALLANGSPFLLPAGEATASLTIEGQFNSIKARSDRLGSLAESDLTRNIVSGQANLSLPLASRREGFLDAVGDISLNLDAAFNHLSDFGTLHTLTTGLDWLPVKAVSLLFSYTDEDAAPSMQNLGDPLIVTTGVRLFDYSRGETVDISRTTGGNPLLLKSVAHTFNLGATIKPFDKENLRFTINYLRKRTSNPTAVFPAATAAIEAAFPDRFTRDPSGQLIAVDARPVNFLAQHEQELRWGFNLSKSFGSTPQGSRDGGERRSSDSPRADAGSSRPDNRNRGPEERGARDRGSRQTSGQTSGPGFRGGRGGSPFGGGRNNLRLRAALYHTVHLQNEVQIHAGGPTLNLLRGDTLGATGGQPRHEVEAQLSLFKAGFGARLAANWQSGTTVHGGPGSSDLRFSSLATFDLRLFANLGDQEDLTSAAPFFRNSRLSLSVSNLFNQRINVHDVAGNTPISFQPAYMDALGRSVSITFRKMFSAVQSPDD